MKKLLNAWAISLIMILSGCAALKSKGGVGATVIAEQFDPKLESVLVVSKVSEYDKNFADNVAPYFRKYFSDDLRDIGVRNVVIEDGVDGKITPQIMSRIASQDGLQNVMLINFATVTSIGNSKTMKHAVIHARITDVKTNKSNWIGTFYWERGLRDYESSEDAGKVLAEILMSGLEKNYKLKKRTDD